MANVRISNLSELTGSPVGTYIVVNNSSEDTTYKMLRSNFLSPVSTFSPTYGLFSQTGDSSVVSGITEQSVVGPGVGSLSIPANGFSVGDTFKAILEGHFSSANDAVRIRIKAGSATLADSNSVIFNTGGAESLMKLELDFVVKSIGGAGTAEILTKGFFKAVKNNQDIKGFSFEDHNNTTFDTTIQNQLDITFEFDNTDSSTYIQSDLLVLTKVY
jgi:hypothetical protein